MNEFAIRPASQTDVSWISQLITKRWGSEIVVVHQSIYTPSKLPGIIAFQQDERIGLITYHIHGDGCEIVTLDSLVSSIGVGRGLIEAVIKEARGAECRRVWLITTNDNLSALRFYQRGGFRLVGVYRDAVVEARKVKPEIPLFGESGIPIRDEIELEMILDDWAEG